MFIYFFLEHFAQSPFRLTPSRVSFFFLLLRYIYFSFLSFFLYPSFFITILEGPHGKKKLIIVYVKVVNVNTVLLFTVQRHITSLNIQFRCWRWLIKLELLFLSFLFPPDCLSPAAAAWPHSLLMPSSLCILLQLKCSGYLEWFLPILFLLSLNLLPQKEVSLAGGQLFLICLCMSSSSLTFSIE